jgi:hypothetical protein
VKLSLGLVANVQFVVSLFGSNVVFSFVFGSTSVIRIVGMFGLLAPPSASNPSTAQQRAGNRHENAERQTANDVTASKPAGYDERRSE